MLSLFKENHFLKYSRHALCVVVISCISQASFAFDLAVPVDCRYGDACVISGYVDTNPEPEEQPQDYTCGHLASPDSKSTRFMLRDFLEMRKGVSVLAAEDGTVISTRDGMDDISVDLAGIASVRGRECGNGVIIEHRRGFITEYCHLMKESLLVQTGDKVQKGSRIGLVGVSGNAEYPQLEFTVKRRDEFYDPFLGDEALRCGSLKAYPLWDRDARKKLSYIPTMLLNAHFINKVPYSLGAREGKFRMKSISAQEKMMVFWVDVFGIQQDDKLLLQIESPEGEILDEELREFKKDKERHFQFIGKKRDTARWMRGEYVGVVQLFRKINGEEKVVIDEIIPVKVREGS